MAYTMTNKSLHGNTYITTVTPNVSVTGTLTPSEEPFSFDIDDSDDPTTTIRKGTGKLTFINEESVVAGQSKLQMIAPKAPFETKVECKYGATVIFTGYVDTEISDQPWDGYPHEASVQVRDMLSMLEEVDVDASLCDGIAYPFAKYLLEAFDAVGLTTFTLYTPSDYDVTDSILYRMIYREWWCPYDTDDDGNTVRRGEAWDSALSKVLLAFGYTMHLYGNIVVIQNALKPETTKMYRYTRAQISGIVSGTEPTPTERTVQAKDVLSIFGNMSASNKTSYLKPYKLVRLTQSVNGENTSAEVETDNVVWDEIAYTALDPRSIRYLAETTQENLSVYLKDADGNDMEPFDIVTHTTSKVYYGAIMGFIDRWAQADDAQKISAATPSMELYLCAGLNTLPSTWYKTTMRAALELRSKYGINNTIYNDGGLCINAKVEVCSLSSEGVPDGNFSNFNGTLYMSVQLGDKLHWTSSGWDNLDSRGAYAFPVEFNDGEIVPNIEENYTTYPNQQTVNLVQRLSMYGASGYLLPFCIHQNWAQGGFMGAPIFTIYCPINEDGSNLMLRLSNVSIKLCDGSGIKFVEDKTEHKVVHTLNDYGEELDISLDSWNGEFDNTTFQPMTLPMWCKYGYYPIDKARNVIDLDDAFQQIRLSADDHLNPEYVYTYGNKKYMLAGRSFNTSTDSGKVKLIQYT